MFTLTELSLKFANSLRMLSNTKILVTNFFSTNKQYVKIKLMQNETNLWSIFLVKTKYW